MKQLHYLIFVIVGLMYQSCLAPVELDLPDSSSKLVVVSNFSDDAPFRIIVSKNRSFDDANHSAYVSNALVGLYHNGELLEILPYNPFNETEAEPGYVSRIHAEIGKWYEIRVSAPGFLPVSSFGFIPPPSLFSSSQINAGTTEPGSQVPSNYWVSLDIEDPVGVDNYYHLILYQELHEIIVQDDVVETKIHRFGPLKMYNQSLDGKVKFYIQNRSTFLTDRSFDGKKQRFTFNTYLDRVPVKGSYGKIIIELRTVSKDYYDYYLTIKKKFDNQGNPLAEPIIDFTNIENGFGVFAGFSVVIDSIDLK